MIGRKISHYKITEKLGEGGMGVVYRAEDTKLGRYVAMKFLPPHVASDEEKKQRFIQEAKTASLIDHPNIGTIHEIDETDDGYLYIVMACYDGKSLRYKINEGPLSVEESVDIALQIATGMVKAHEHGIIHRDLKPGNILITNDDVAKIIDFGLAKLTGGVQLTKSNTSLGTVAYMSPEQARGEDVDSRSDIWSLGVILFEMLTAKLPFRGEFETALLYSITNENPLPIETFRSSLPFNLKLIVAKALQKERNDRYQDMNEFAADLKALIKTTDVPTTSVSDWKSASRAVVYALKKDRWKVGVIGSIVALALIVAGIIYFGKSRTTSTSTNKSIAVLPVSNIGDPEQVYYASGFSAEIANELSSLKNINIITRQSISTLFADSSKSDSAIIAQLGVHYLLKGEIQVLATRVKYHAFLIDGYTGKEIWNNRYDISRDEIFTVKKSMVNEIADAIGIPSENITPSKYQTTSDVYESYLHGMYYRDKNTKQDNILAITFFTEAVRKDSNYLPALIALANAQLEQFRQGWDRSEKLVAMAESLCKRALSIDSNYTNALAEYGVINDLKGNSEEALRLLLKAYDEDKNSAVALTSIAIIYLFELGDPAKGVMYLKQLHEIDPLNWLTLQNLGVAYGQIKNYPEAIKSFHQAYGLNPNNSWPPYSLGYVYERIGQMDSAEHYYRTAIKINPATANTYEALTSIYLVQNKYSAAESVMTAGIQYLPNDLQILYCLGTVYWMNNRQSDARKIYNEGLGLVKTSIENNPNVGENQAWEGLFLARLGRKQEAIKSLMNAVKLDSTNEEIIMKVVRGYAIMGLKNDMLNWFKRVKGMNTEYDVAYLRTALDFEKFRSDPDLLIVARQ
jgi:serine/threonine protein kinase/Flp pilus assembly protein TadD